MTLDASALVRAYEADDSGDPSVTAFVRLVEELRHGREGVLDRVAFRDDDAVEAVRDALRALMWRLDEPDLLRRLVVPAAIDAAVSAALLALPPDARELAAAVALPDREAPRRQHGLGRRRTEYARTFSAKWHGFRLHGHRLRFAAAPPLSAAVSAAVAALATLEGVQAPIITFK